MQPRDAKEIIDQALEDNRFAEYMCYGFCMVFVFLGVSILIFGAISGKPLQALVGAITTGLFLPAMNNARSLRRESIKIRLLELRLGRADTAKEAIDEIARMVKETS